MAASGSPAAGASGASSRSRLSTYVSSPVRSRPRTSASTTTSGSRELPPDGFDAVRDRRPRVLRARSSPRAQLVAPRTGLPIPTAIAATSSGSTSTAAPPATSSVAPPARHHRRAGRHRLQYRDAEPLVQRRKDERASAAVERGEPVVETSPTQPGVSTLPQPRAPTTRSSTPARAAASVIRRRFLRAPASPPPARSRPRRPARRARRPARSRFRSRHSLPEIRAARRFRAS